jgi:hypothetical protein
MAAVEAGMVVSRRVPLLSNAPIATPINSPRNIKGFQIFQYLTTQKERARRPIGPSKKQESLFRWRFTLVLTTRSFELLVERSGRHLGRDPVDGLNQLILGLKCDAGLALCPQQRKSERAY